MKNYNYHLAKTAIEEFWDKNEKIIFLGEWCKLYDRKHEWKRLEYDTLDNIWKEPDEVTKALTYCNEIYEIALIEITKFLNNYHGLQKDSVFYRIILGNWLYHYIHQLYDKYLTIRSAFDYYPDLNTYVLDKKEYFIPNDYAEFTSCIVKDKYALQMYSQILCDLGYDFVSKPLRHPIIQSGKYNINNKYKFNIKSRLFNFLLNKSYYLTFLMSCNHVMITNPYFSYKNNFFNLISLVFLSKLKINFNALRYNVGFNYNLNYKVREFKLNNSFDEFTNVLYNNLVFDLPALFLEIFKDFRKWVLSLPIKKPDYFFSANALSGTNNIFKFYCAEYYNDLQILNGQHGGGYGIFLKTPTEDYERSIAHFFYTSGWSDSCQTIPLSVPKFCKKFNDKKRNSQILFTINEMPRYVYRIQYTPMANSYYHYTLPSIYSFINELELNEELLIRIYPPDRYGWQTQQRIKDKFHDDLHFDNFEKKFDRSLEQCCLFVSSGAHTTYLEALAANKPTVIFLNKNIHCFREQAQPYMDQLEKVGILHWSGEDAAKHINNIYNDLDNWWLSREVQNVKNEFVEKYARCNKNWPKEWADEFNRVLNNIP